MANDPERCGWCKAVFPANRFAEKQHLHDCTRNAFAFFGFPPMVNETPAEVVNLADRRDNRPCK
jgi:hypothetical protein